MQSSSDEPKNQGEKSSPPKWWQCECPVCGYMLYGLNRKKCPECGVPLPQNVQVEEHMGSWGIRGHRRFVGLGAVSGAASFFLFDYVHLLPGVLFAIGVVIPLLIRQKASRTLMILAFLASSLGYVVAPWICSPFDGLFADSMYTSFAAIGMIGTCPLAIVLFRKEPNRILLTIVSAAIVSLVFPVSALMFEGATLVPDYLWILTGFLIWQSTMALVISNLLTLKTKYVIV